MRAGKLNLANFAIKIQKLSAAKASALALALNFTRSMTLV